MCSEFSSGSAGKVAQADWPPMTMDLRKLRDALVATALSWEKAFGAAPRITSDLSELDAANIVGCSIEDYSALNQGKTAVQRGFDFVFEGVRYQVKANRPSGKPGSPVTLVGKARNYDWDVLIWVHYNSRYEVQEAWAWSVAEYKAAFHEKKRLGPADYRRGRRLV